MQGDSIIAIGREAGCGSSTPGNNSGTDNISIGMYAGKELTSGSQNVLLGRNAGCDITSGGKNVVIGYQVAPASNTGTGQLAIGCNGTCWISGDSSFILTTRTHVPETNNTYNLGSASLRWANIYTQELE